MSQTKLPEDSLSKTRQKCILCDKYLSGHSQYKVGNTTIDLAKNGEKLCMKCEEEYCNAYPQFASTEICQKIKQRTSTSQEKQIIPSKSEVVVPTRKSPYLDVRCQICKKYVMKRKTLSPLTTEEQMDEKVECSKCKEACQEIQSDHPTDIKFCQMVHDILTSGML